MSSTDTPHISVLRDEVIAALAPRDGGIYLDGTFGAGGYSRAILAAADCRVIAIDRDPDALARGRNFPETANGRLTLLEGRFGDMAQLLADAGIAKVDGVALDIGVSSMQIDQPERGFSFAKDGPLDMRMERTGSSAADLVNTLPEDDLADLIYRYGEERHSRRIARAIATARMAKPFEKTLELADVVRSAVRKSADGIHPATRTFQALRIAVNDELGELERGLDGVETILATDGRLAVVTFHSLEDRLVKTFLKQRSGDMPAPSRHAPSVAQGPAPTFTLLGRKAVAPGEAEIACNPRSRSAKLRAAQRTPAAAWTSSSKGGTR